MTSRNSEIQYIFVYGTLRPDDTSGAMWTKPFNEGMIAWKATVSNCSLYFDRYPVIILHPSNTTSTNNKTVTGFVVRCKDEQKWKEKLEQADIIEGYPNYYNRTTVAATIVDKTSYQGNITIKEDQIKCFVYYREKISLDADAIHIKNGDFTTFKPR